MPLQDYFKRQIDQMALVLAKLFSKILGLKESGNYSLMADSVNDILCSELNLSPDDLNTLNPLSFIDKLSSNKSFDSANIELLSEIFYELASSLPDDHALKIMLFERSISMLEYIEFTEKTFSIERQKRIASLKILIQK